MCGVPMCGDDLFGNGGGTGSGEDEAPEWLLSNLEGVRLLMRQRSGANLLTENRFYSIGELYDVHYDKVLGTGVSGTVCLGTHRKSKTQYAIKVLNKKKLKTEKLKQLQQEIRIMASLNHPNTLRLQECFESKDEVHLVLELLQGGELLDRLHAQPNSMFPENVARQYVRTILATVRYCHAQGIVHRDLKLENFLFETTNADSDIKLIDFGLSQRCESVDQVLTKSCGTPYYVSPEVLECRYTSKCDVWSVGVITYMLLSGSPPFYGRTDTETLKSVKAGRFQFLEAPFKNVSAAAKAFIRACLVRGESKRPSAEQLMSHHWFVETNGGTGSGGQQGGAVVKGSNETTRGTADTNAQAGSQALPTILEINPLAAESFNQKAEIQSLISKMARFGERSGLGKLFLEVVARTLTPDHIIRQRVAWNRIDKHRRGVLLVQDLTDALLEAAPAKGEIDGELLRQVSIAAGSDGTILFHEFLAATVSDIAESNLRMAFDKISSDTDAITREMLENFLDASVADVSDLVSEAGFSSSLSIDFDAFRRIVEAQTQPPAPQSPYVKLRKGRQFLFD